MAQIANTPDGNWKTNGLEATKHLTARYASLSRYADKIMRQAKLSGSTIPCSVLDAYNKAVNDYLSFGNRLFDLFHKNKMTIEQVIYTQGKPAIDSKGNVRTLRINAPLRPPTFVLTKTDCPGITHVTTTGTTLGEATEMGLAPAVIAAYAIGGLLFIGVGGYVANKLLEKMSILIRGPVYTPDQVVSAYVKCLDNISAHVAKTHPNLPASERERIAAQMAVSCSEKSKGESGSGVPVVLLGLGFAAVAGIALMRK